jgi:hypothetical protein
LESGKIVTKTGSAILRQMSRSTLWFAIAAFWFVDALLAAFRHHLGQAALTSLFAIAFLVVAILVRRSGAHGRR